MGASDWKDCALGEVLTLQRGFDLPKRMRKPGFFPVVSSAGVTGFHNEPKVDPPGVVIGRYGSLGSVHWIDEPFWPLNTSLWVRDFKGNDARFVSYLLQTVTVDGSTASAVPGVNRNHLHKMPVRVPDVGTQKRIAVVLSVFDELIEINERRIELLEDLAQSLYREWFVHFRFPGHEEVALQESRLGMIPTGWKVEGFSDLASFLNGFAFKPAHHRDVGLPVIKIKELKNGVTAATPRCDESEIDPKFIVEPGDLLFSWSADLGVYLWSGERGALNQHLFKVQSSTSGMTHFLLHALSASLPEFQKRAQGTTMRHIKRSALSEVMTAVPPTDVIASFESQVGLVHRDVLALHQLTAWLVTTRDLLLPRLVTGQLDISDVDLGVLAPAEAE